jgi:8-oxo-dGTP pyrophosphatase MutT (NUDIX family)
VNVTRDDLRRAAALSPFDDDAARERMGARPRPVDPSRPWRDGAVLILFFPGEDGPDLLLTRRTDTVEHHRAQIAFPGGRREEGEDLLDTALRETTEEVGIPRETVEVLGDLAPFAIPPSGFVVHPFVGWTAERPECRPDPVEVAEILEVPLRVLMDPERHAEEESEIRGKTAVIPFYDVPGLGRPPLWGATAMMLAGFLGRLEAVSNGGGR